MKRSFLTESERIKLSLKCEAEVGTTNTVLQNAETSDQPSEC